MSLSLPNLCNHPRQRKNAAESQRSPKLSISAFSQRRDGSPPSSLYAPKAKATVPKIGKLNMLDIKNKKWVSVSPYLPTSRKLSFHARLNLSVSPRVNWIARTIFPCLSNGSAIASAPLSALASRLAAPTIQKKYPSLTININQKNII